MILKEELRQILGDLLSLFLSNNELSFDRHKDTFLMMFGYFRENMIKLLSPSQRINIGLNSFSKQSKWL